MESENFYVTLPSNVRNTFYANTVANFRTKLATRLELQGVWECGLASISYTRSWNVKKEIATINTAYFDGTNIVYGKELNMDLSNYTRVEDIVKDLNKKIIENVDQYIRIDRADPPALTINKEANKIEIKFSTHNSFYSLIGVEFSQNLCSILGIEKDKLDGFCWKVFNQYKKEFNENQLKYMRKHGFFQVYRPDHLPESDLLFIAQEPYNIYPSFRNLYVYCDVIDFVPVGNTLAQLLKIVEIPSVSKFRDQVSRNYSKIDYHPVLCRNFDEIEIDIKDETGATIPFQFGRSILLLHFRKIQ